MKPALSATLPHLASRPATELGRDVRACVVGLAADGASAERLSAMGLGIGAVFQVLRAGCDMTVRVGESTLALGEGWARALRVVEL